MTYSCCASTCSRNTTISTCCALTCSQNTTTYSRAEVATPQPTATRPAAEATLPLATPPRATATVGVDSCVCVITQAEEEGGQEEKKNLYAPCLKWTKGGNATMLSMLLVGEER